LREFCQDTYSGWVALTLNPFLDPYFKGRISLESGRPLQPLPSATYPAWLLIDQTFMEYKATGLDNEKVRDGSLSHPVHIFLL
jgi:hypothetical protein